MFTIRGQKAVHYSTIQRYWKRQPGVSTDLSANDVLNLFKGGTRVIVTDGPGPVHIAVGTKLLWILFLSVSHIKPFLRTLTDTFEPVRLPNVCLYFDFLLWYDGAKLGLQERTLLCAEDCFRASHHG